MIAHIYFQQFHHYQLHNQDFEAANVHNAALHWAWKLVFPNSHFRVGSRGARRIPSFPLGNTTSDYSGMIFPTGKLTNTSF